jgi:CheY-like chemotaxis protein
MNAIIGMTNIVKKKLGDSGSVSDEIMGNIDQIEISSQHLLGLLNDILDISKIEAGKIELSEEVVDLSKLVHTVETIIKPRCDDKNIIFVPVYEFPPQASFTSDSLRLRQVLINLLGNAVKFTPECGEIKFSVAQKDKKDGKVLLEFAVKDNGIGISPEAQAMLFKPFEQTNNQISHKYGGTGLGLAISQSIVQLLGGDISVRSVEGKGSDFSFSLWLPEAEKEAETDVNMEDATGLLKGKRALLVDDVEINRVIAVNLLEYTGITIDEADDGVSALKIYNEKPENFYDIIYMDVQMPNMNGYDAATAIRNAGRADSKTIPIVALTANAFKEDIDKAIASGMNAHLAKPMEPEKVLEITLKLLS